MSGRERFPAEIAEALDVLGERENRELLTQLWDTDLYETAHSDGDLERLDTLKTAGLANKQIHRVSDDGEITSVYRLSEYGRRWIEAVLSTLGDVEKSKPYTTDSCREELL